MLTSPTVGRLRGPGPAAEDKGLGCHRPVEGDRLRVEDLD